jgi:putative transposase
MTYVITTKYFDVSLFRDFSRSNDVSRFRRLMMAYEYRKLTPKEREEVTRIRNKRGYPLHSPPHPIRLTGYYLITAACNNHESLMNNADRRTEFEARLLEELKSIQAEIIAWVVLPNHYHFLACFDDFDGLPAVMKRLHTGTSYEWNRADGCTGQRRVWYHYSDRFMRSENQMNQAFNYIHYNPVKHGYVKTPYDWMWSSLNLYEQDFGREWLRERWAKFPPGEVDFE